MANITWKIEDGERTVINHGERIYILSEVWGSNVKVLKIINHGLVYTLTGHVEKEDKSVTISWSEKAFPQYLITIYFDIEITTTYVLTCKGNNLFIDDISCSWPISCNSDNSNSGDHESKSFTACLFDKERTILIDDSGESAMTIIGIVPGIDDTVLNATMSCSIVNIEMMKRTFTCINVSELVGDSFSHTTRHML